MEFVTSAAKENPTDVSSQNNGLLFSRLLRFLFFSLMLWQLSYSISDAAVKMMIVILKKFLSILSRMIKKLKI